MSETYKPIARYPDRGLTGRRKIYTDAPEITAENVVEVLGKAWAVHLANRAEIQYLYNYYRGRQDIRLRQKAVRPEIKNVVTVNRANEIVAFKTSYLLGEPMQYVSRGSDDAVSEQINVLNEYMYAEDKASKDKEVADWMNICGVGCRLVLPDNDEDAYEDGSPVCIYTLDPREAFVVYSSNVGNKPMAGVLRRRDASGNWFFCVYTKDQYFEIQNGKVLITKPRTVPFVPIVEYVNNEARQGAFEIVIPLLNAINALESNRVDDIEQFVQCITVFENCEIDDEQASALKQSLGLMISSTDTKQAKVYRVAGEISQSGVQTAIDDLYDTVLTICGMPNRNGGSSTSDTGTAVILRDGYSAAESRAKDTEQLFTRSDREFLRIVLYICAANGLDLKLSNVGVKFTRRNYEGIQSKTQVLCEMLNSDKIHPKLAFQSCGLFTDSEDAYRQSMQWYEQQQAQLQATLEAELNAEDEDEDEEPVSEDGQGDSSAEPQGGQKVSKAQGTGGNAER